ncbi:uncharacterized protein DNG_01927 [Cephalotrichum gorgonifer]|uniref:Uncharacterized protein n=1 Tax=Cephalotrichum gorgonifer TaxID=2041049 RepID=A0AAE8MRN6_9PEZI|nr:uncharacterized protein DNG_01927 [Cephalotrichum gorgonifer]
MDPRVSEDSGSSESGGAGSAILPRLSFMKQRAEKDNGWRATGDENIPPHSKVTSPGRNKTAQHDFARRKASLRKVVLGREAVRDRLGAEKPEASTSDAPASDLGRRQAVAVAAPESDSDHDTSDVTPWPEFNEHNDGSNDDDTTTAAAAAPSGAATNQADRLPVVAVVSPPISYKSTSTTDEDEGLLMAQKGASSFRSNLSISSGLDTFFANRRAVSKRRPSQIARPPLSYTAVGLSTTNITPTEEDDYGETEMWGWALLVVTWFVFVTGVGSCFGVWSWVWDVGKTPYAPPELEDDPTLPIVGYYPALIILTCFMSWIWVVVAWIGMKYFRHAKITGD